MTLHVLFNFFIFTISVHLCKADEQTESYGVRMLKEEEEELEFANRQLDDEPGIRMLGGEELPDHPYMASITEIKNGQWVSTCLGTIISTRWILTSGICVVGMELRNVVVDVGKHQLHGDNLRSFRHTVNGLIVHPDFSTTTGRNDIALLLLNEPIDYNSYISPIHLGSIADEDSIKIASIGWGKQDNDTRVYHGLRLLTLKISQCAEKIAKQFPTFSLDKDKQICGYSKGKLLCQDDEGGPLIAYWEEEDDVKQVGIFSSAMSNNTECSVDDDHPLVFTRISDYMSWINNVTYLGLSLV